MIHTEIICDGCGKKHPWQNCHWLTRRITDSMPNVAGFGSGYAHDDAHYCPTCAKHLVPKPHDQLLRYLYPTVTQESQVCDVTHPKESHPEESHPEESHPKESHPEAPDITVQQVRTALGYLEGWCEVTGSTDTTAEYIAKSMRILRSILNTPRSV